MNVMFFVWALAAMTALLLLLIITLVPVLWERRKIVGEAAAGLLIASALLIAAFEWSWLSKILLLVGQIWLIIIALRLVIGRLDSAFLRLSTQVNVLLSMGFVAVAMIGAFTVRLVPGMAAYDWRGAVLLAVSFGIGILAVWQVLWTLRHYSPKTRSSKTDGNLPTVSVCIPARNEDHALTECLTAVLASDYPKLEVLVLDDCSQDSTSHLIKSFAHDGVRFIQGDTPAEGWLGKNQAMKTLAQQASGDLILFMGVDTLVTPQSISHLVHYARQQELDMVSVLPQQPFTGMAHTLLAPLRYAWQIALPITPRRVPVCGKAWLINADTLRELGGFESVPHKIVPEGSFARRLHTAGRYHFIVSNDLLGMITKKQWSDQARTSLRILYPTLKRQPMFALAAVWAILFLLVLPFALVILYTLHGLFGLWFWLAVGTSGLLYTAYGLILVRTHPKTWFFGTLLLPIVLLQEIGLIVTSMLQYEFGRVDWKGRNVCYPVIKIPPRGFGRSASWQEPKQ